MRLQTVLAAVLVAACGGGDAPIRAAQAQSAPPVETRSYLHFALRPDAAGRWRVQSDSDHASAGVLGAEQDGEFVYVLFDRRYTHAGTVIVTSDDDFSKAGISAGCNLGVTATRCVILVTWQQGQTTTETVRKIESRLDAMVTLQGAAQIADAELRAEVRELRRRLDAMEARR